MRRKFISHVVMVSAALVIGVASPALAQLRNSIRFHAPVGFQAGQRFLPAGDYVIEPLPNRFDGFMLSNGNTQVPIEYLSADGLGAAPDPKHDYDQVVLTMDKKTSHYVLCQLWDAYHRRGVQMNGTYPLTHAAKTAETTTSAAIRTHTHTTARTMVLRAHPAPAHR